MSVETYTLLQRAKDAFDADTLQKLQARFARFLPFVWLAVLLVAAYDNVTVTRLYDQLWFF